jgi:hypothetical protein
MTWIDRSIKWIMLVSGLLTLTMIYAALAPSAALRSTFGESLEGPVANIVVRNWGALIGLIGAMLIYGAFRPAFRPLVLVVAGLSKIIFIGLILGSGRQFLGQQLAVSVVVDAVMVLLFASFLLTSARQRPTV